MPHRLCWLLGLLSLTAHLLGCGGGGFGGSPDDVETGVLLSPLNSLEADINVRIGTGDAAGEGRYCEAEPLKLCVGFADNCYALDAVSGPGCRNVRTGCYDTNTTCRIARHELGGTIQDDHPFVNHPDDWDNLFIVNDTEVGFVLESIEVEVDYTSANQSFTFVDQQGLSRRYDGGARVPMRGWVRQARQQAVEQLLGLPAGGFFELPKMIQQGAYDLGQGGIVKYKPWEDGSQNGCDEFYAYFASQFSNNIHFSCGWDDDRCTYFRNWKTNNSHGALGRSQFQSANRLARVVFGTQVSGGATNRTAIEGIYRLDSRGRTTGELYVPKPGDFFFRENHSCVGNFHAMMYVGGYQDLSGGGEAAFQVDILHKSSSVRINTWDLSYAYLNRKVNPAQEADCVGHEGEFQRTFYFGEADHDVDPDGAGPLTSGARPEQGFPVTGPNLGFRATQTAILSGTL